MPIFFYKICSTNTPVELIDKPDYSILVPMGGELS